MHSNRVQKEIHMIKFLANLKLKYKLMLSYFAFIILPLIIFSQLSFLEFSKILENRIIYSAEQSFNQGAEYVTYKIHQFIGISDSIAINSDIKEILERDPQSHNSQLHKDNYRLNELLYAYNRYEGIVNISIYINNELLFDDGQGRIASIDEAKEQRWFSQIPGAGSRVFMVPPSFYNKPLQEDTILSLARRITRSNDYIDSTAYLRIDFDESDIRAILENANSVDGSLTYIRNRDDRIVSTTNDRLLEQYKIPIADIERLHNYPDWVVLNVSEEECYVRVKSIKDTDWSIVTVIPLEDIYREVADISRLMLIFLIVIIPITISFSVLLTYQITKRLSKLSVKMKQVSENRYEIYDETHTYGDDIGELVESYNYMVKRISTLAEEQYKTGLNIKSTELELLQSQINPHFLYNTLDMINWMSYENRSEEIRKITKALSTFYKISLSKGEMLIPLQDELRHVSLYMEIQNYRLQYPIELKIDCPEYIKQIKIPKITLQPLVENAILHGILSKESKTGTICIRCRQELDHYAIYVEDDGIGMDPEKVETILDEEEKSGYGLKNINTRLILTYNQGGLFIESQEGIGTIIKLTVPRSS